MASKTIKEINARNRKRADFLARQMERLLSNPDGPPIEITPEIERALNTPVSQLPVDFTIQGAIRRAGGWNEKVLAHIRLAKMRTAKRKTKRAGNTARTKNASDKNRERGEGRREIIRTKATALLRKNPDLTRETLADLIAAQPAVHVGRLRVLTVLKELKLPPKRKRSSRHETP